MALTSASERSISIASTSIRSTLSFSAAPKSLPIRKLVSESEEIQKTPIRLTRSSVIMPSSQHPLNSLWALSYPSVASPSPEMPKKEISSFLSKNSSQHIIPTPKSTWLMPNMMNSTTTTMLEPQAPFLSSTITSAMRMFLSTP